MNARGIAITLSAVALAACAHRPRKVYIADNDPLLHAIVADVSDGIGEVYEASETILIPTRAMTGTFNNTLINALRDRGFTFRADGIGEPFDCRVDVFEGPIYRVEAHVGTTTLSRLWVLNGADAYSGGSWARTE
ncbi:hypothetical protein [Luteibacter sp. 329MFSha]|uniref:hypothetical protein n=1 Tax=Luteibacter sp. 329MFSha TaxID=1798239 RepID=UPI0008AFC139|nr:hypothetical protein [Luteibacter sp. 329MFSha]SEW28474.1 hypothetical protein SAMN04515660_3618 [Luteibacter sp. 329MFSha]